MRDAAATEMLVDDRRDDRSLAPKATRGRALAAAVAGRLGGFALSTIANGLTAVFVIAVVVRSSGASGWTAIAVGQSIGAIAAVVVIVGWGITGPVLAARCEERELPGLVSEAMSTRVVLWLPVTALGVGWAVSATSDPLVVGLMVAAGSTSGLTLQWCFVGRAAPMGLFLFDSVPRVACALVGGVALLGGMPLAVFAAMQVLGALTAVTLSTVHFRAARGTMRGLRRGPLDMVRGASRERMSALGLNLVSTLYLALPVIVVAQVLPAGAASFALADRLQKQANVVLQPGLQVLQGWVPAAHERRELQRRIRAAIGAATALALMVGAGFFLLAPLVASALGEDRIALPSPLTLPYALVLAISVVSQCTGTTSLVALGRTSVVLWSAVAGAGVGLASLFFGAAQLGTTGAAWSVVLAETAVLAVQVVVLAAELRSRGARSGVEARQPVSRVA